MTAFSPQTDPALFACPCGQCGSRPSPVLLARLEALRAAVGRPLQVTSGPRCPAHNARVGGVPDSEHLTGEGADVASPDSATRWQLLRAIFTRGLFSRVGVGRGFIHVGVSARHAQNVCWTYYT